MSVLLALAACLSSSPEPVVPPSPGPYWQLRTDAELEEDLATACARSVASGRPLLLAFSAPWCIDCRTLRVLEGQEPLATELANWEKVVVDVGRFDRHEALLKAFGVDRIVYWAALRPDDCSRGPEAWPVLRKGIFEPKSDPDGPRTPESVAAWLTAAR